MLTSRTFSAHVSSAEPGTPSHDHDQHGAEQEQRECDECRAGGLRGSRCGERARRGLHGRGRRGLRRHGGGLSGGRCDRRGRSGGRRRRLRGRRRGLRRRRCRLRGGGCGDALFHGDGGVQDILADAVTNDRHDDRNRTHRSGIRHREGAGRLGAEFVFLTVVDDDVVGGSTQGHGDRQGRLVFVTDGFCRGRVFVDDGRLAAFGAVVAVRRAVVHPGHGDVVGGGGRSDFLTGLDGGHDGAVVEREGGIGGPLLVRVLDDPLVADAVAVGVPGECRGCEQHDTSGCADGDGCGDCSDSGTELHVVSPSGGSLVNFT